MQTRSILLALAVCALLTACSAKTDEPAAAGQAAAQPASDDGAPPGETLTDEQMDELRRTRTVAVVFKPAAGSGGQGEIMKELQAIGGPLREPNLNYDVYDPQSNLDKKALKQEIEKSLDSNRQVLVDNGGTPESRQQAAAIVLETTGGSIPDAAATIIRKPPPDKGNGYLLIPIYSQADVQAQVAQGLIPNAQEQTNSAANFFFEPTQK